MASRARPKISHILLGLYAVALVGLLLSTLVAGAGYYGHGDASRAAHALHPSLRPGGPVGLALGIVGTLLMLGILAYRLRKFLQHFEWLGSMQTWLQFHIICGVLGPLFILLHAGISAPHGFIAFGFWCMVLVALSGVFGRYVYGHFPRAAAGRGSDLDAAHAELSLLREQLVEQTAGARASGVGEAIALARELDWTPTSIVGLLRLDLEVRHRERRIRVILAESGLPPDARSAATSTITAQLHLKRSLETWQVSRRLFRYWHLFHLPLARAMYILVALHIFNAIVLGGALATLRDALPF